jgi:hypothetical membrane protein
MTVPDRPGRPSLSDSARREDANRRRARLGGLALLAASVQFFVCHLVVQSGWYPPYSWAGNNISDLGNVHCGAWGDNERYVCSPDHALMNGSFVATGVLLLLGLALVSTPGRATAARPCPGPRRRAGRRGAPLLLALAAAGWATAGLFPADANLGVHLLAAVGVFLGGNAGLVATGLARGSAHLSLRRSALLAGSTGIAGTFLFFSGHVGALGMGGMERVAALPVLAWAAAAGVLLTARAGRATVVPVPVGPGL